MTGPACLLVTFLHSVPGTSPLGRGQSHLSRRHSLANPQPSPSRSLAGARLAPPAAASAAPAACACAPTLVAPAPPPPQLAPPPGGPARTGAALRDMLARELLRVRDIDIDLALTAARAASPAAVRLARRVRRRLRLAAPRIGDITLAARPCREPELARASMRGGQVALPAPRRAGGAMVGAREAASCRPAAPPEREGLICGGRGEGPG